LISSVNSQKFNSTADIMEAMKDMFRDVLQQVLESELEEQLGYEKSKRLSNVHETAESKNYRNGYSKKTVKTQIGEIPLKIPRDRNGEKVKENHQYQTKAAYVGKSYPSCVKS
jgi:putative transposase